MTLTFFRLLAAIVLMLPVIVGKQSGVGGTFIGVAVGLAMGPGFYFGLRAFLKWLVRRRPGIFDPQEHTFINKLITCSCFFLAIVWFIVCAAFASWFTNFQVRRWQ